MDSRSTMPPPPRRRLERRPERGGLGAGGAAQVARRRAQGAAPLRQGPRGRHRLRLDAVDPGVLRAARAQLHQGVGALELVGLPAAAAGAARQRSRRCRSASPGRSALDAELVADIERASFALLDYLARMLAGKHGLARCRCSRSTARCRKRSRPSACIRPTCGRWTGAGARSRTIRTSRRTPPMPTSATQLEAQLLQLMRGTQALTRGGDG